MIHQVWETYVDALKPEAGRRERKFQKLKRRRENGQRASGDNRI